MIKLDVQLEDYHQSEHGGYVLRMLGELYDSQVQFFKQGSGVVMTDPVAAIDSHVIDIIKYQGKRCGIIMSCGSGCFENTVSISDIILEEGYRRKGIARKALSIVISRALADGAEFVGLNVHTDNIPAVRLYESLGFRKQSQWMVMGLQNFTPNDGKPKTPKPEEHVTQEELARFEKKRLAEGYEHEMPFQLVGPTMLFMHGGCEYAKMEEPAKDDNGVVTHNALQTPGSVPALFAENTMVYALFSKEEQSCGGPQEACMQPGCSECGCPADLKDHLKDIQSHISPVTGESRVHCHKCGNMYDVLLCHDRPAIKCPDCGVIPI